MARTNRNIEVASTRGKQARTRARVVRKKLASGEPLYRQLLQSLRSDILRGVLPPGSQLPSEEELTSRFAVSRHTVREALRHLRADGLVSSRQGSGTTVMPPPSTQFNVHRVASIDELIAYAAETRYAIERSDMVKSEAVSGVELELPPQQRWLRLQGFRIKENEPAAGPVCWTEVLVSADYSGVERLIRRWRGTIWQLIEENYGERIVEVEQTLRVRTVPEQIAAGLRVDVGSTVVEVTRAYKTAANKVAELAINLYPADKFRFAMKLQRA